MRVKYLLLSIVIAGFIVYMSSVPNESLWGKDSLNRRVFYNLGHIPGYGLLAFLSLKAFCGRDTGTRGPIVRTLVVIGIVLFAALDEIHQSFTPGRLASGIDLWLDGLGIILAMYVFAKIEQPLMHGPGKRVEIQTSS